jgi:cellulose synthase operon protein C
VIKTTICLTLLLAVAGAQAQKRTIRTQTAPQTANERPKTVGEVLKNIANQYKGQKFQINKYKAELPKSDLPSAPVAPKDIQAVKPPRSSELFRSNDNTEEAQIEKITDQSISQLYKITQRHRNSPNRGEIWLRLAELYVEKSRLLEYRRRDEFDKKMTAFNNKKLAVKPKLDLNLSHDYNKKAIQLYEWFLRDFPKDKKADQALFFLGFNYFEIGQIKKGLEFYGRLTKEHPNSPYISEANFAIGEYYFDLNDWKNAFQYYEAVVTNRRSRLYTFALYKTGWCLYRIGRVKDSINRLETVVKVSRQKEQVDETGRRQVNRIRLASEALKDLIVFYAESGEPRSAPAYFEEIGGNKLLYSLLEKLAYRYSDTGKREAARFIFKYILDLKPTAPKAVDYQYQIVMNYQTSGDQKTFRVEMFSWIEDYGVGSAWSQANAADKELIQRAYDLRESTLRNYTLHLHKSAQASRAPFAQQQASQNYALYVKSFPDAKNTVEMRFFYGELLYDMKKHKEAGEQYLWVADNGMKTKYHELAIVNLLLALEHGLPPEEEISAKLGKSLNPVPFGENEAAFVAAAERYLKTFPKGEKVVDVKFKVGRLHYASNHLDDALKYFRDVCFRHPAHPNAIYAANLILDIYNLRKDYDGLGKEAHEMLKIPQLAKSGFGNEVRAILERAQFKKAQDNEVGKNFAQSAVDYEGFSKSNPGSELATSSQFNAAVNYERAGQFLDAIRMYGLVIRSRDKNSDGLRLRSQRLLARLYEETGQYARAAAQFENFAKDNPKDASALDFHYNAAVIQTGLKFYPAAVKNFEFYFAKSKKRDKAEVLWALAEIAENQKSVGKTINYLKQYIESNPANRAHIVEAHYKIADYSEKLNRRKDADEWFNKTIAVQRRLGKVGVWYAAEATLRSVRPMLGDLKRVAIPANPAAQGAAVQKKLKMLDEFGRELTKVIKFDSGDQIVTSLALLGEAYDHMARSIDATPVPKGLNADETAQYKAGVAKITDPFKSKALENYQASVSKAFEISAYNDTIGTSMRMVNSYKPGTYPEPSVRMPIEPLPDLMGM